MTEAPAAVAAREIRLLTSAERFFMRAPRSDKPCTFTVIVLAIVLAYLNRQIHELAADQIRQHGLHIERHGLSVRHVDNAPCGIDVPAPTNANARLRDTDRKVGLDGLDAIEHADVRPCLA